MKEIFKAYPDAILNRHGRGRRQSFTFRLPAAYLLSRISGTDFDKVRAVRMTKAWWVYPWYAITLGRHTDSMHIYMSKAYFDSRKLGNNAEAWLAQMSHELIHIQHREVFSNQLFYILSFAWDYIRHFSHDTPREREADQGTERFYELRRRVNHIFGNGTLMRTLNSPSLSDDEKIEIIKGWFDNLL